MDQGLKIYQHQEHHNQRGHVQRRGQFSSTEKLSLQRSGLYRDRLKISFHTAEDGESDRSNVVCILSPGSTQLVSKMGLLCKEADGAITRMLPLPFFFLFCCQYWAVKTMEMFQIDNPLKPLFY